MKPNYQMYKAMTWLIDAASEKEREVRVWDKLAYELLNAAQNEVRLLYCKVHRYITYFLSFGQGCVTVGFS